MAAAEHPTVASLLQHQPVQQTSPPPSSGNGDSLVCQWMGCGEHATSPEALYEHVCERHVGRKSTNNLNLQCQWGGCRTTTVKRDHITSHIRVHVPLKPHKCDFCGKSFKRPQDLKKHVKTHADDSILLRSPAPPGAAHSGYQAGLPKVSNGYYADAATAGAGAGYGYGHSYPHSAVPPPAGAVHGYGGHGYPIPNMSMADSGMMENRKRGHDMLEQFFSDAKRRQIDAHNYMDLGARFGGLHGLQMGLGNGFGGYNNGYGGMGEDYGSTAAIAHYQQMPQPYTMFNELKTKSDLMSIDEFLEQLQNTVYENPDRSSPPNIQPGLEAMVPTPAYSDSRAPSLVEDTPTPASNYSTNSPASVHSTFPGRMPNAGYPQLPSVNSIAHMDSGYNSAGMPLSGIGEDFQDNGRRRYSSSNLTRANPAPKSEGKDEIGSPDAMRDSPEVKQSPGKEIKKAESASPKGSSNITLPPIRRTEAERSEEERNEAWVENMRVIEHLRHYVQFRLERKEYDDGDGRMNGDKDNDGDTTPRAARTPEKDVEMTDREKEAGSLYPVLRAVQASD